MNCLSMVSRVNSDTRFKPSAMNVLYMGASLRFMRTLKGPDLGVAKISAMNVRRKEVILDRPLELKIGDLILYEVAK